MSDEPRDVVRRIEVLLDAKTAPGGAAAAALAVKFSALCAEANQRLRECSDFIARQSHASAVQLAERPPNLLETVVYLEFPQADQWRSVCESSGWQIAETLDKRAVNELNEAYAKHASAESFLAGLASAVHRDDHRAAVLNLRNLRRRDPQNDKWQRQLKAFEDSWLQQLGQQVKHCGERGDLAAMERLNAELQAEWMSPREARQVRDLAEKWIRAEKSLRAAQQAAEIIERLGHAHGAKDMAALAGCLAEYERLLQEGFLEPSGTMQEIYSGAKSFSDETRQQKEVLAQFNALIGLIRHELFERQEPNSRLLNYAQELRQFQQCPIPDDVQARLPIALQTIHEGRRVQRRNKTILTLVACLAVLAVLGAASGMMLVSKAGQKWAREIEQDLLGRDAVRAEKL